MELAQIRRFLDEPEEAHTLLRSWGLRDLERGYANAQHIADANVPLDLLAEFFEQLSQWLPGCPDPDMALNNLDRFVASMRSPLAIISLFERDREALPILVQIFSTSQYFSDLLIADNEAFELLRITQGQPVSRESLIQELCTEVLAMSSPHGVSAAIRRFKRRETLRIGYGDIVRNLPVERVTEQISYLADAIIEAAVRAARISLEARYGSPQTPEGKPAQFAVIGMGKLGGTELNYSSDIDLIFLYEVDGMTTPPRKMSNKEFFERLAREVVKLLTEFTEFGQAYRVDLRLRPDGGQGTIVHSKEAALQYYDLVGRTWERQAYLKARAAAGSIELGEEFLKALEPWIYRRYLGIADISGVKTLKRRIEKRTQSEGGEHRNVKTGRGGIRDIEFVIQFLQLLNAGDLPQLRTGNTLAAMAQLEQVGCLTSQERIELDRNYRFLRKIEHRLQFMFDLQTHLMPEDPDELRRLALRMGYENNGEATALAQFEADYQKTTDQNRKILDHLLHDAFPEDPDLDPEGDLVLDPDPSAERIAEVLARYGFQDVQQAYKHLMALATEHIRYLMPRRCRLFFASITKRLLEAIAQTPDPDQTLVQLVKVSDSLGGKVVLWELFRFNPPTLRLYVELCCSSPMLSEILINNPGMIDELMDTLVLNRLPGRQELRAEATELCRAAEDIDPILHSFKNSHLLTIGVRDILDKEPVESITGALSDVAEACLEQIIQKEMEKAVERHGQPQIQGGPNDGKPCELIVLALGKFGGRELSYHSDLDLVFLYEADGRTLPQKRSRKASDPTTNQHFFGELVQRIIKATNIIGPHGRLYEIDIRLRPTGKSGAVVTSIEGFQRYFKEMAMLWERQSLCRARVLYSTPELTQRMEEVLHAEAYTHGLSSEDAQSIRDMRLRMEDLAATHNLKRGSGGIVDIEFIAQMLQLKHGKDCANIRVTNTSEALQKLQQHRFLSQDDGDLLRNNYRELRKIEGRLRLTNPTAGDNLPTQAEDLDKFARQLHYQDGRELLEHIRHITHETRERFNAMVTQLSGN